MKTFIKFDKWLKANQPSYERLDGMHKVAIGYFTVAWSLFEYRALGDGRGWQRVVRFVDDFVTHGGDLAAIEPTFTYFRDRYYSANGFNAYFDHLTARADNETTQRIQQVLSEDVATYEAKLVGLLLIIYCLRNNLLHGDKWAYGFGDQIDNFATTVALLNYVLDTYCPDPASYTARMAAARRGNA